MTLEASDTVSIPRAEYQNLQRRAGEETNPFLREEFNPNCPCHGQLHLPMIVKLFVDTRIFKRMKHIKQLGMCSHVYPGAVHDRFFHSIGTAHLAYEMIKGIRTRQPELCVTDEDVLCVVIAALCHDLGHPAFSHMFEEFMHAIGKEKREALGPTPTPDEEALVKRYESWNHEEASLVLLRELFKQLEEPLRQAGLTGTDLKFIEELIDPPKRTLCQLRLSGTLRQKWGEVICGRPVEKAFLLEIVSNWRSGLDVDKFDYFRRDAKFLGIKKQFQHSRYFHSVKVVTLEDQGGVSTLSVARKDKDMLRENVLELRKSLHRSAYQHKTVKKLELHMVKVLRLMDEHCHEVFRTRGKDGRRMKMSEAAVEMDVEAYAQITDSYIEGRLFQNEDDGLDLAREEYNKAILERRLMRLVGLWEVRRGETKAALTGKDEKFILDGVLQAYYSAGGEVVDRSKLKVSVVALHYGMKDDDPLTHIFFHDAKSGAQDKILPEEVTPLDTKVFLFYDPGVKICETDSKLVKLIDAFKVWAAQQAAKADSIPSPSKVRLPQDLGAAVQAPPKKRRTLKIESTLG